MPRSLLDRRVNGLGILAVTSYAALAVLSFVQTPVLWDSTYFPHAANFFDRLFGTENVAAIRSFFGGPAGVLISHGVILFVASAAAVALIILLSRDDAAPSDKTARLIFRWSIAFAGVSIFAYPVFTQDFWLSAIWGGMIASGANPYYQSFTPDALAGLPLDHFSMTMSYGPLWGLISAGVMTITAGNVWATAIVFKVLLFAAWCGTLILVDRILYQIVPAKRAIGMVIIGWVPLGVSQTVAEGHNDIVMVFPAMLWFFLLLRKQFTTPLALAASVLCKYTTAPLFLVDALHGLKGQRLGPARYVKQLALPLLLSVAVMAIFYRSLGFFDGVHLVNTWHFMQPIHALAAVSDVIGDWFQPVTKLSLAIFPAVAAYQIWLYWKAPGEAQLCHVALAVMCAVTFSLISHIWPWYLVWTLPLAALVPSWWLSRFVVGLCLAIPFTAVVWWVPAVEDFKDVAALVMYLAAILWTFATARSEASAAGEIEIDTPAAIRHAEFTLIRAEPVQMTVGATPLRDVSYHRPERLLRADPATSETSA